MRILATTQAIPGHLRPMLAITDALCASGHEVAVYSGRSAREAVEERGLRFFGFDPAMDAHLSAILLPPTGTSIAATAGDDARRTLLRPSRLRDGVGAWLLDTVPHQLRDLTRILDVWRPDVVVADMTLFGAVLILKDLVSIPVAVFSPIPECTIPGPDAPPWGPGLPRHRHPGGRLLHSVEQKVIDWLMAGLRDRANRLRAAFHLPPIAGRLAGEYARVPLLVVAGAPELDYERGDLPPCVHYVGPCDTSPGETAPPPWLDEVAARGPIVHVTEGTVHTGRPVVLSAAARGLADAPVQVVMTTGGHRSPASIDLAPLARNIRVEQFAPHEHLLPRTSVLVTTGSAGTVTKALTHDIPVVIVPIGWEHPETAQRLVDAGAGVRVPPSRCTPARLRHAVDRVLSDPGYRLNARRLGAALRSLGGARRAAGLIERLASAGAPARAAADQTPNISQ